MVVSTDHVSNTNIKPTTLFTILYINKGLADYFLSKRSTEYLPLPAINKTR